MVRCHTALKVVEIPDGHELVHANVQKRYSPDSCGNLLVKLDLFRKNLGSFMPFHVQFPHGIRDGIAATSKA